MHKEKKGVTLIEVLIGLAIITILLSLTIGGLRSLKRGYARAELECLYQACLYMQYHARLTGQQGAIHLDVARNSYICNGHEHRCAPEVCFGIVPGLKGPPAAPKKSLQTPCTFSGNCITCSTDGVLAAGTVYIKERNGTTVYAVTSGVAPYSYLRKYRYAGKWQPI